MSFPHWDYFLSVEADLADCTRYVEFSADNYNTYSVAFARVIVIAAAEFDVVAKGLCNEIDKNLRPQSINEYCSIIVNEYPKFVDYTIHLPRFKIEVQPWKNWIPGVPPDWWSNGYNKIKHQRDQHFANANLINAIDAVAGLLTGIVYLYDAKYGDFPNLDLNAGPKLLQPQTDPSGMEPGMLCWTCNAWL